MIKRMTLFLLVFVLLLLPVAVTAQGKPGLLLPIGAGYTDTYNGMAKIAIDNARGEMVHILILASTYSTNALSILEGEFNQNMRDAEERRLQTEGACQRNLPEGSSLVCKVDLLPVFSQEDAQKPENLALLTEDVAMIFILGGDQETGMGAIINTPIEQRINELHAKGMIIAGTSAGAAMQSRLMIADLEDTFTTVDGLYAGSVKLWKDELHRGFDFGVRKAIVDQHFVQRARMGRLLNVISQPGNPHIGVGVDAYTGVVIDSEVVRDVFGLYTVTILDADTYHSADAIQYVNVPGKKTPIISLRNIVLNLMSPGDVTYDLNTRVSSMGSLPTKMERKFDQFVTTTGAGVLILGGDQLEVEGINPAMDAFKKDAGEKILIIATGYPSGRSSDAAIKSYQEILGGGAQAITILEDTPVEIPEGTTGILVISKDVTKVNIKALASLKAFWQAGGTVMADNAAAPLFGAFYSNHTPTPSDAEQEEIATQRSFWQGRTKMEPGMGWVKFNLEPQMMNDLRFGRLFSLAFNHPQQLSVGLNSGTAMRITADGATALGVNGVFVLDVRKANLKLGTNDGFIVGNAMLDSFAPGEPMLPTIADMDGVFEVAPTPVIPTIVPTATETLVPTFTPGVTATQKIAPTSEDSVTNQQNKNENASEATLLPYILVSFIALIGVGAYLYKRKAGVESKD